MLGRKVREITQRLSNDAAAEYVGLAPQTLNRWRGEGRGPRFMKLGSRVVYDQADLDEWLAANRRRSTSEYEARGIVKPIEEPGGAQRRRMSLNLPAAATRSRLKPENKKKPRGP